MYSREDQVLTLVIFAPEQDVRVRIVGVVVLNADPVQLSADIPLDALHYVTHIRRACRRCRIPSPVTG